MMALYFAYGSNLDPEQMVRRCPSARFVCLARLSGHRLTFPRSCESWGGGVAGVELCEDGRCVEGVIYDMSDDDLRTLDGYEGIEAGDYDRREVELTADDGRSVRAWIYFANPDPAGPTAPSRRYLGALIRGARSHGMPQPYIADLERIETRDLG